MKTMLKMLGIEMLKELIVWISVKIGLTVKTDAKKDCE